MHTYINIYVYIMAKFNDSIRIIKRYLKSINRTLDKGLLRINTFWASLNDPFLSILAIFILKNE